MWVSEGQTRPSRSFAPKKYMDLFLFKAVSVWLSNFMFLKCLIHSINTFAFGFPHQNYTNEIVWRLMQKMQYYLRKAKVPREIRRSQHSRRWRRRREMGSSWTSTSLGKQWCGSVLWKCGSGSKSRLFWKSGAIYIMF